MYDERANGVGPLPLHYLIGSRRHVGDDELDDAGSHGLMRATLPKISKLVY
jgi:hypothetical protein